MTRIFASAYIRTSAFGIRLRSAYVTRVSCTAFLGRYRR